MPTTYSDGTFTSASVNGPRTRIYPFDRDRLTFYTEQRWVVEETSYSPLPLNTADTNDATSFLVAEKDFQGLGGGLIEWTRTYSKIPKPRSDYETFTYTFPGFVATVSQHLTTPWALPSATFTAVDLPGRKPLTLPVTSRVLRDYFLVGTGQTYATPSAIPIIHAQRYVYGTAFTLTQTDDLPDKILYGGVNANFSVPTVEQWRALILAGTEIVAEESAVRQWMGNIYERSTRYVVAL